VTERELELAGLLVEALAAPFEPGKYQDRYRQNLPALLEAKLRSEELKRAASEPILAPVPDILEGLKASLARVKKPAAIAGPSPVQRRAAVSG
jgi:DNA end-binding protein Ku